MSRPDAFEELAAAVRKAHADAEESLDILDRAIAAGRYHKDDARLMDAIRGRRVSILNKTYDLVQTVEYIERKHHRSKVLTPSA